VPLRGRPAPAAPDGRPGPARRHVVFALGGIEHAVPAQQVRHSLPADGEVGRELDFLGQTYPVVDLRSLFRLPGPPASTRLILLVEGDGVRAALVVDRLVDLVLLEAAAIVPLPPVFAGVERRWFTGLARLGPRILLVLRVEGILGAQSAPAAASALHAAAAAG
jgi:purine-binding chemotaxis protein CheW